MTNYYDSNCEYIDEYMNNLLLYLMQLELLYNNPTLLIEINTLKRVLTHLLNFINDDHTFEMYKDNVNIIGYLLQNERK